jgi:hypothetical protein
LDETRSAHRRRTTRRRWAGARAIGVGIGCTAAILGGDRAWSAEVRVRAVDSCADVSAITEQAEVLLGRPLASVEGVDFEVDISAGAAPAWRLRVDTVDRADGSRRTREIAGHGCAELADAAAVAIAMSVNADPGKTDASAGARDPAAPGTAPPVSNTPPSLPPPGRPPREPIRPAIALGLTADAGALPGLALGAMLAAELRRGSLRLAVQATLLPSAETRMANGIGGDFQLIAGAVLACFGHGFGRWTGGACAGGEVGRLSGEGMGVSSPRLGSALWLAGRAELAADVPIGGRFSFILRAGIAVPTSRPGFVVDGTLRVHQASRVTARSLLGFGITF